MSVSLNTTMLGWVGAGAEVEIESQCKKVGDTLGFADMVCREVATGREVRFWKKDGRVGGLVLRMFLISTALLTLPLSFSLFTSSPLAGMLNSSRWEPPGPWLCIPGLSPLRTSWLLPSTCPGCEEEEEGGRGSSSCLLSRRERQSSDGGKGMVCVFTGPS